MTTFDPGAQVAQDQDNANQETATAEASAQPETVDAGGQAEAGE